MAKERKFKLIEEETLRDLLKNQYQQSYAIILLSYICRRENLDASLTITEACGVLKLSPRQVNDARIRCQIRALNCGKFKLYSIYDLAMLAANLHRRRPMSNLKNIPSYIFPEDQDK